MNGNQHRARLARLDHDRDLPVFLPGGLRLRLSLLLWLNLLNLRMRRHCDSPSVGINFALLNKLSTKVASPSHLEPETQRRVARSIAAAVAAGDERNR
jgi:hypothetical protein